MTGYTGWTTYKASNLARPSAAVNGLRGAPEPHDADVDAPLYATDERVLEEMGEPSGNGRALYGQAHQTLRVAPAMEAGIADHVCSIKKIVGLLAYEDRFMGKREDIADLLYAVQQVEDAKSFMAHPEGVLFSSLDLAKKFIANHAARYELGGRIDGKVSGWLVRPRASKGPTT